MLHNLSEWLNIHSHFPDWGSAIMLILAGTKEEHLNMLEGGIIAKLLEEKWTTFAQVWTHPLSLIHFIVA